MLQLIFLGEQVLSHSSETKILFEGPDDADVIVGERARRRGRRHRTLEADAGVPEPDGRPPLRVGGRSLQLLDQVVNKSIEE